MLKGYVQVTFLVGEYRPREMYRWQGERPRIEGNHLLFVDEKDVLRIIPTFQASDIKVTVE
jgi:hypothetical protein